MSFRSNTQIILNELDTVLSKIDPQQTDRAIKEISSSNRIFFHALGRAAFAGKSFVMRLMHMGREVYVVGETNTPNFGEGDLLIICSGSGETAQFVQIANKARSLGGRLMVFTGNPESTLARMSDAAIIIQAPAKNQKDSSFKSVQPMASLFEQGILIAGDAIILCLMEGHTGNDDMFKRHSNLE